MEKSMLDSLNDKEFLETLERIKINSDTATRRRIEVAYSLAKLLCAMDDTPLSEDK